MPSPYESNDILFSEFTNDISVDALLGGTFWKDRDISYSFPTSNDISLWSADGHAYGSPRNGGEPWNNAFAPLSDSNQNYFRQALQQWAHVAEIEFEEVNESPEEVGDIRAAHSLDPDNSTLAWSYLPTYNPIAGDIWINAAGILNAQEWNPGSLGFETLLHEIGHALGLKHPFAETENSSEPTLPDQLDKIMYTIMSYTYANLEGEIGNGFSFHPTTPMVLDIAAIQYLYGPNDKFHRENDTYIFGDTQTYHETIWDAGGSSDTIQYIGNIPSLFDLNPGAGSLIGQSVYVQKNGINIGLPIPNLWIADHVSIENVIAGQGNDILVGNNISNLLDGDLGIDTVVIESSHDQFFLTQTDDNFILTDKTNSNNQDILSNIERLTFNDSKLALDLDGHAGEVVKMLGAVYGASSLTNLSYVSTGLTESDNGLSYEQLGELAIDSTNLTDHAAIVTLLWKNLFGTDPLATDISPYVDQLDHGELSIGILAVLAADSIYNVQNINLSELYQTGVAYL